MRFTVGNWYDYSDGEATMVNRHDFLLPLVQSVVICGNQASVQKINELFEYWIDSFSIGRLIDHDTPIDSAIRLINWAWVLNADTLLLSNERMKRLCTIFYEQLEYIYAWRSAGGNHLVLEALSHYVYAAIFCGIPTSKRWADWSERCLLEQLLRQTTADGVHTEQSMFYHQAVSTHYLKFFLVAAANGRLIEEEYTQRYKKMLKYVHDTIKPNLTHPVLGDGEMMFTDDREHWEARSLLAAFWYLYDEPVCEDFLPHIGDASIWLLGCSIASITTEPFVPASKVYEESGLAVFRDGDNYLFFDAAPFSDPEFPHHGHADALHVELSVRDSDLFVDPGGYGYYDDEFRRFFRSTAAHNTVTLDGLDQSQLFGVIGYGKLAKARIERYALSPDCDYIAGSHDGYFPFSHLREVFLFKRPDRFILIIDYLQSKGEHRAVARLHLANGVSKEVDSTRVLVAGKSTSFETDVLSNAQISQRVVSGLRNGEVQGWLSHETKKVVKADTWELSARYTDAAFIAVIVSLEETSAVTIRLETARCGRISIRGHEYLMFVSPETRTTTVRGV